VVVVGEGQVLEMLPLVVVVVVVETWFLMVMVMVMVRGMMIRTRMILDLG